MVIENLSQKILPVWTRLKSSDHYHYLAQLFRQCFSYGKLTVSLISAKVVTRKLFRGLVGWGLFPYHELPLISPGLIQLLRGFEWAYKWRGLYPGGGGGL